MASQVRFGQRFLCVGLDDEGAGVGTLDKDGERLLVHAPGLLPGDEAKVLLAHVSSHKKPEGRHAWAQVMDLITPSPDRVDSPCARQGECGGCPLMPLRPEAQLAFKRARVIRALAAHASLAGVPIADCVPSSRTTGYRNLAKFAFGPEAPGGTNVLGAYAPRSHRIVDQSGCVVIESALSEVRAALAPLLAPLPAYDETTRVGLLRHVVLRANRSGKVLVALVVAKREFAGAQALADAIVAACPRVDGVVWNVNAAAGNAILGDDERILAGQGTVDDDIGGVTVRLSARSFFQANRGIALELYAAVKAAVAAVAPVGCLVDVYSGAGGIARTVSAHCREVIAVEENPATTAAAEAFHRESGIHLHFITGDAAVGLGQVDNVDVVVVNPPRKGCARQVLDRVLTLRLRRLVYVSCDPDTLARDLAILVAGGARVLSARPFDMFPHTPHVETLAVVEFPAA